MPSSRSVRERVEERLASFLRARTQAGQCLLVACSGGSDSSALLAACAALAPRFRLKVVACWLDHGLRPRAELDSEAALLKTVCAELGVALEARALAKGAVKALARSRSCGIEAAARSLRRATLREVAEQQGASLILLGHTRDDQAETLLMRVLSGSGAAGLRGMAPLSGRFGRPFLNISKRELRTYLEHRGLAWSEDSSNASDDYTRNRFRHALLPVLESVVPGWRRALSRLALKAAYDEEALSEAATALVWRNQGSSLRAELAEAARLPMAVLLRSLGAGFNRLGALQGVEEGERLPWGFLESLATAVRARKAFDIACSGARAHSDGLSLALEVPRAPPAARMPDGAAGLGRRPSPADCETALSLRITGPGPIFVGKAEVLRVYWTEGGAIGIPEGSFEFPLLLRSRRPGDPPHPGGQVGTKAVPLFVAEDAHGVVCLIGAPSGAPDIPKREHSPDARRLAIAKGTDPYAWV